LLLNSETSGFNGNETDYTEIIFEKVKKLIRIIIRLYGFTRKQCQVFKISRNSSTFMANILQKYKPFLVEISTFGSKLSEEFY
jgi:hypothetical protein